MLGLLPSLVAALHQAQGSPLLRAHATTLSTYLTTATLLLDMLNLVIADNASISRSSKFQRVMAVRGEVNGLLDLARQTLSEVVGQMEQYVKELEEEHALPLALTWHQHRGWFIKLTNTRTEKYRVKDLPEEFQRVQKQGNAITFVTTEFVVKERLVQQTKWEIATMSNSILDELLVEVREHIAFLYQLSEVLCSVDMLLSLATVSMGHGFVRPQFGDELCVRQGRHPILDTMPVDVVANDTRADPLSRLHVLTGPNMSGKSTYLRQVPCRRPPTDLF